MRTLIVIGLVFFFGNIILIIANYEKFEIERYGQVVKMRLERVPGSCIGTKVPYFVTFSFQGKKYDKATRGGFCNEHHVGDLVEMKMLEGSEYVLFPNESAMLDLISFGILSLFGLILSVTQWKKLKNQRKTLFRRGVSR